MTFFAGTIAPSRNGLGLLLCKVFLFYLIVFFCFFFFWGGGGGGKPHRKEKKDNLPLVHEFLVVLCLPEGLEVPGMRKTCVNGISNEKWV